MATEQAPVSIQAPEIYEEWKEKREDIRVLIIGDKDVGKSSLWWTLLENEFPDSEKVSRQTKEKINAQEIMYADVTYKIIFEEDESSEENGDMLNEQLSDTDVALLLFSIIDIRSFQNVKIKWCERIREKNEDLPIIFVGNKVDLREEATSIPGLAPVTTEEVEEAVQEKEVNGYAELSAKQKMGLKDLLRVIVDGMLDGRNKKFEKEKLKEENKSKCLIM